MARKTFAGPQVDVTFDGALCQHSGNCVKGMPAVFDTSRNPWIDPTRAVTPVVADMLRDVVGRCPSRALEIAEHD